MSPYYEQDGVTLWLGDCRSVLGTLPEASIDACVTDPPYGLSREPDVAEVVRHWLAGDAYEHGTPGFMGRSWDSFVPGPEYWREVARVMKPGAYLLAFAGTRTWDLLSIAIRFAGLENRDTIRHDGPPALGWVHGQGFPKSADVSKAIDRAAGAEREVVGRKVITYDGAQRDPNKHSNPADQSNIGQWGLAQTPHGLPLTAAATAAARTWDGWGTALKPAWEVILVFRKPLEGTVAANVLRHGCGALNIDACRVGSPDLEGAKREHGGAVYEGVHDGYQRPGRSSYTHKTDWHPASAGRYPPNLLLSHTPDCVPVGVRRVRGSNGVRGSDSGNKMYGGGKGLQRPSTGQQVGYADADGCEEVEAWSCAPGCAVAALDAQAGVRSSNAGTLRNDAKPGMYTPSRRAGTVFEGSSGPASRFYPTFAYFPKASQSDRRHGVGKNAHPTCKNTDLMRWLCRLVTRPGGVILDPFLGSGSTGVAALEEGFNFIGIEQDPEYLRIARGRLAAVNAQLPGLLDEEATPSPQNTLSLEEV